MHAQRLLLAVATLLTSTTVIGAQQGFTDAFPPEEFAARRARVMQSIGDGVAILQGTTERRRGESPLRQSNQFFYLTGVVEPRALPIIDGRTHPQYAVPHPANSGPATDGRFRGQRAIGRVSV